METNSKNIFMKMSKPFLLIAIFIFVIQIVSGQDLLLRHANVLTMESSEVLMDYDVFIKADKIVSIEKNTAQSNIPKNIKVIDLKGKYLMPGLIDMHVHLFDESELLTNLYYGVTTVFNMDGSSDHLEWREKTKNRNYAGARILTAGNTLDGYPALNWMFWAVETPEQARKAVQKQKKDGYDFIKIYGTLNPDVFEAIQDEALRQNLTVVGHIPRQVGIENALKNNYSLIAHGDDLISSYFNNPPSSQEIDNLALLLSKSNIYLTPNLSIQKRMLAEATDLQAVLSLPENRYVSPAAYSQWIKANNRTLDQYDLNGFKNSVLEMQKLNKLLTLAGKKYGVKTVAGTDCATLGFPGSSLFSELEEMVSAGLSEYEALNSATNIAGEFLKTKISTSLKLGKIKSGYLADLIVLNENPFENISSVKNIAATISKGVYYPTKELEKMLAQKTVNFTSTKRKIELADSLLESGETKKGLQILKEQALLQKSTKVYAQWVLGIKAMRLQDKSPENSLLLRQANTVLYPSHFSVYNELGIGFYEKKNFDLALKYFQKSDVMAPSNAVSNRMIKKIQFAQKEFVPLLQGNYKLERIGKNGEIIDTLSFAIGISEKPLKKYSLTFIKEGNKQAINNYEGNTDRIWFKVPGNYGEIEYSLWVEQQKYFGSFSGMFGNNGTIKVTRLPE